MCVDPVQDVAPALAQGLPRCRCALPGGGGWRGWLVAGTSRPCDGGGSSAGGWSQQQLGQLTTRPVRASHACPYGSSPLRAPWVAPQPTPLHRARPTPRLKLCIDNMEAVFLAAMSGPGAGASGDEEEEWGGMEGLGPALLAELEADLASIAAADEGALLGGAGDAGGGA